MGSSVWPSVSGDPLYTFWVMALHTDYSPVSDRPALHVKEPCADMRWYMSGQSEEEGGNVTVVLGPRALRAFERYQEDIEEESTSAAGRQLLIAQLERRGYAPRGRRIHHADEGLLSRFARRLPGVGGRSA